MKKLLIIAAMTALVMISLFLAGYGALQTDRVQRLIKNKIESAANEHLNARLTIGSLSGNLLWNTTLNDVTVQDAEGLVFSAAQISVDYVLVALLKDTILIPRIKIVNPELNLRPHREKDWNVLAIPKASESSPSVSDKKQELHILVHSMIVQNGLIRVQPEPGGGGPSLDVQINMKAALKGETASLEELKLATSRSRAAISGRARLSPGDDQLDLVLKLPGVWLPELSPFLHISFPERELKGEFTIKGDINKADITYQLSPDKEQSLQGKARVQLKDPMKLEMECAMKALQLQPWLPSLPATVTGSFKVALTNDQLMKMNGQAQIELASSSFFGQELERGRVSILVKPGLNTVLEANLTGPSGELELSGAGVLGGLIRPQDSLEGNIHLSSAKADLSGLDIGPLQTKKVVGSVKLQKEPGAPVEKTHMDLDLSFGPTRWWKVNINAGSIAGDFEYGRFSIGKAEFQLPEAWLKLTGAGDIHESVTADINLGFQDLLPLSSQLLNRPVSGTAEATFRVFGSTARPRIQGTITGANLSGFGSDLDSFRLEVLGDTATLEAQASFSGKQLSRKDIEISSFSISGTMAPEKAMFKARVEADRANLVALNGSITNLDSPSKRIAIHPLQLTVKGKVWNNSEPIVTILNPDSVQVKALGLVRGGQRISATGTIAYKGQGDVTLSLNNMRLNELMAMAGVDGPTGGVFNSRLHLTGTTAAPLMALDIDFTKVKWDSYELSSGMLHLDYARQSASVKATVHSPVGDTLNITGAIPVNLSLEAMERRMPDQGLDLAVEGKAINLAVLSRFIPVLHEVQARADLRATMKGNPFDPMVNGTLMVDGEKVLFKNAPEPIRHLRAEAEISNREIRLKRFACSLGEKGRMEVYGAIGLKGLGLDTTGMNLHVDGNAISLALLPQFVPALREVQARADVKATVKGNPLDPEVNGILSVKGEKLVIQGLSETVRNLEGEVSFDSQKMQVKRFTSALGKKGRIEINGTARLKHFQLTDILLRAQLHDAPIQLENKAKVTITTDLTAEGALDSLNIRGNVVVTEGTFYADQIVETSEDVVILETEVLGEKKVVQAGGFAQRVMSGLTLDGRLKVPGNVWVKGLGINVELKGDLTVSKKAEKALTINGDLTTVRGFYEFKQKTFQIERGKVQFIGLPEPDPLLDIQAAYHVSDVTVYLVVGGSLSQITLNLNSDPSMDETDIMAYLLFGKPVSKLGRSESNEYQQTALSFFGAGVTDKLKQVLGERFSLDVVTLEGAGTGFGAGALSLGKYITRRIFVTYKHVGGLESKNQVEAEYEINNRFSIESTFGDDQTTGADIFWRYDY